MFAYKLNVQRPNVQHDTQTHIYLQVKGLCAGMKIREKFNGQLKKEFFLSKLEAKRWNVITSHIEKWTQTLSLSAFEYFAKFFETLFKKSN